MIPALLAVGFVGALVSASVVRILIPVTGPMLEEVCRGAERGRFWTRFLGISLVLALPVGVTWGLVAHPDTGPWGRDELSTMLHFGIQLEAIVLVLVGLGIRWVRWD